MNPPYYRGVNSAPVYRGGFKMPNKEEALSREFSQSPINSSLMSFNSPSKSKLSQANNNSLFSPAMPGNLPASPEVRPQSAPGQHLSIPGKKGRKPFSPNRIPKMKKSNGNQNQSFS